MLPAYLYREEKKHDRTRLVMNWPPESLDLNKEQLWNILQESWTTFE